jgi:hypothetical protein
MHNVKHQVGQLVANDTQASTAALDTAVLMQTRLFASTIEAASDSNMPISATQGLLESISAGINDLVQSRAKLALAVRHLNVIQGKSNLRETDLGCPGGLYPLKGASTERFTAKA